MLHYCAIQLHTRVASILLASASASTSPILIWFSGKLHKFAVLHENLDQWNVIPFTWTFLELTKDYADLALQPTLVENTKKKILFTRIYWYMGSYANTRLWTLVFVALLYPPVSGTSASKGLLYKRMLPRGGCHPRVTFKFVTKSFYLAFLAIPTMMTTRVLLFLKVQEKNERSIVLVPLILSN